MPGTPLHAEVARQGRVLADVDLADIHGQYKFNFRHAAISRDQSKVFLDRAFRRDYEKNGPSLYRLIRTMAAGWKRYRSDPDARVRERVAGEGRQLRFGYGAPLWAMEHYLRQASPDISERIGNLRQSLERDCGRVSRWINRSAGSVLLWSARREARVHPLGRRLEPRTFVTRRNW
jgi:hypothetical protein